MSRPTLVVVCLVPAAGHLIPLLKIAAQVRTFAEIRIVVPDELIRVAAFYGFSATGYGPVEPAGGPSALHAYGTASELVRVFGGLNRWYRGYFYPIIATVRKSSEKIKSLVAEARPTWILADFPSYFMEQLVEIASAVGAPLYTHGVAPHHEENDTWTLSSCFFMDARSALQGSLKKSRNELRLWARQRAEKPDLRNALPACLAATHFPPGDHCGVVFLSTGTRFLERALLADRLLYAGDGRVTLPALPPLGASLGTELQAWLECRDEPVAYVSFGTLIEDSAILSDVINALLEQGMRVVVQGQRDSSAAGDPARLRQEAWVSQADILSHPSVSLFVTHGGSSSVEEALWYGKPMIVIPHAWDQHFNAWIAAELNTSVTVRRYRIALRHRVRGAAQRASGARQAEAARQIAHLMQACWLERGDMLAELFRSPR